MAIGFIFQLLRKFMKGAWVALPVMEMAELRRDKFLKLVTYPKIRKEIKMFNAKPTIYNKQVFKEAKWQQKLLDIISG